jgi:hypothetical protein
MVDKAGSQVNELVFGACVGRFVLICFGSGTGKVQKPDKAKPSPTKDEVLTAIKLGKAGINNSQRRDSICQINR